MLPNFIQPAKISLFKPQTNPISFNDDEPLPKLNNSNPDSLNNYFASDPFKLELKSLHKTINLKETQNELPLLLSLKSLDPFKLENGESIMPFVDLVLVIDHSGSMEGLKLKMVRNTIKALMGFLREDDRVSVVIFDDKALRLTPLVRLTETNRQLLSQTIDKIEPDGGTNIHLGLEFALEILRRRRSKNAISSILLLSDGLDEESLVMSVSALEKIPVEGHFTINTFGYGDDHDSKQMLGIANLKGGSFYYIDKLDMVEDCFIDCLGGLLSIVGINLILDLQTRGFYEKFVEEVKIQKFFGDGEISADKTKLRIKASHIIAGTRKDYVVILKLSKLLQDLQDHEKSVTLAIGTLSFEKVLKNQEKSQIKGNNETIKLKSELNVTILNNDEEVKDYEKEEDVEVNFLRVMAAEGLEKAQKDAEVGNFMHGQKEIDNVIEKIQNSKRANNLEVQNIMGNLQKARGMVQPKTYEDAGKHYIATFSNNYMQQQSHPMSSEMNCNSLQNNMLKAVRMKKK